MITDINGIEYAVGDPVIVQNEFLFKGYIVGFVESLTVDKVHGILPKIGLRVSRHSNDWPDIICISPSDGIIVSKSDNIVKEQLVERLKGNGPFIWDE